jgi:hypothetical protein
VLLQLGWPGTVLPTVSATATGAVVTVAGPIPASSTLVLALS